MAGRSICVSSHSLVEATQRIASVLPLAETMGVAAGDGMGVVAAFSLRRPFSSANWRVMLLRSVK